MSRGDRRRRPPRAATSPLVERAFAPVDVASIACFRIAFGAVMAWEVVRYFRHGWIASYFIQPEFHFTYHLNQFRLARRDLTYGALVDEWLAERDRRRDPAYEPPLAEHGKYNRFIRDFFADERNRGKSLRDAAAAWNAVKHGPGDQRYRRRGRR